MKKVLCVLMSAVLLLGLAGTALASPFYLETAGVTIEVPEGMTAEDISTEEAYALKMTVDGREDLAYVYALAYEPAYEGKWLEDLTEEEGNAILAAYSAALENPSYGTAENDGISYLIAANEAGTQLHYVSVLNGWVCDVAAVAAQTLTEDEIALAAQLLTSITFDEAVDAETAPTEEEAA